MDGKDVVWFFVAAFGLLLAPLLPALLGGGPVASVVGFTAMAGALLLVVLLIVRTHRFIRAARANPELAPSRRQSMLGMGALASLFIFLGATGLALREVDIVAASGAGLVLIGLLTLGVLAATRSN